MRKQVRRALCALNRRVTRGDGERGMLSLFVAISVLGVILVTSLVVDAGGRLDAGVSVDEYASEAARAGSQQIDVADAVKGKSILIDCTNAKTAVNEYLSEAGLGLTGTTHCSHNSVTVQIKTTYPTEMLSIIGIDDLPITGSGTATLVTGQQNPNPEQP